MKICLTANSGGHLNQLLQLKSFYKDYEYFFITDRNAFSEELAGKAKVYFVEKFIIREVIIKLQFFKLFKNFFQTLRIFIKEKPDIVITTGAGVSFGALFLGKLFGYKTVFIESIARVYHPSTFGTAIGKYARNVIVQWKEMQKYYKKSVYGGLIFNFDDIKVNKIEKINNIFLTAGTYKLQFNRLFAEMDKIADKFNGCKVVGQIGMSDYIPQNYNYFDFCGQEELHKNIEQADLVICQGGSGSIMDSLLMGKRVIAIPRLPVYGEFFDDHQIQLTGELEKAGLILVVRDIHKLNDTIKAAVDFVPDYTGTSRSRFHDILKKYLDS